MRFVKKIKWLQVYLTEEAARRRIPLNGSEAVSIAGKTFCMVRTDEGIFATANRCPHQGFHLGGSPCIDGTLICPLHRFGFDIHTGKGQGMHLETYPVETREDGVFVGVEYRGWEW